MSVIVILVGLAWWQIPVVGSAIGFLVWRAFRKPVVTGGYATRGDVRISYTIYGNGRPLLLLHGGLSSSLDWLGEIPALAQHFRVVTIDLRGHGRGDSSSRAGGDARYRSLGTPRCA
jgi:alpha-beta hydrolase superfamily lysophospholipase